MRKHALPRLGADKGWSTAAAGEGFSLGVKNNELFTWGKNDNGQLAGGSTSTAPNGVPTSRGTGWTKVSAGDEHALALKSGGTGGTNVQLFAWGFNASGHVGNSTSNKQFSPVRINTAGVANTKWKTIAGGTEHSLAIRSDGSLWAWGSYEYGRLTTDWGGSFAPRSGNRTAPFRIGTDTDWKAVSAGTNHSLALKSDGTLWAWGGESFRSAGFRYAPGRDWGIDFPDNAEAGGAFSELGRYQHRRPRRG